LFYFIAINNLLVKAVFFRQLDMKQVLLLGLLSVLMNAMQGADERVYLMALANFGG
jgi:hypothetical protein